jgi:hypothetical protein
VVLEGVRPDPAQAPTGMRNTQLGKFFVDDFGVEHYPEAAWNYLPAAPGQRDTTRQIVVSGVVGTRTYTHTITLSNRCLIPVTWSTRIDNSVGPTTYTNSWLHTGDLSGSSMQMSSRHIERWNSGFTAHYNQNQGGSSFVTPLDPTKIYGGRPIYYATSGNVHESCVSPLDFATDNGADTNFTVHPGALGKTDGGPQDLGGSEDHPVWYYGERIFMRLTPMWKGNPLVHRVDYWAYKPTSWDGRGVSNPILNYLFDAVNTLQVNFYDGALFADLATGILTPIADFLPASPTTPDFRRWVATRNRILPPTGDPVSINTTGYAAAAVTNAANNWAVAAATRLADTDFDLNTGSASVSGAPNSFQIVHYHPAESGNPGTLTENPCVSLGLTSKAQGPCEAGWHGMSYFIVPGFGPDVLAALQALYVSGDLDSAPPLDLPAAATAGTAWPPDSQRLIFPR